MGARGGYAHMAAAAAAEWASPATPSVPLRSVTRAVRWLTGRSVSGLLVCPLCVVSWVRPHSVLGEFQVSYGYM